jgi:pilus assembly protein FimV
MEESVVRNLTKTLAVLSLLAPAGAHSLGVGDIKLHSALNQKLNAEIALTLATGENAADIRVKLAPIEKFDQSGIPWTPLLRKIKFEPVLKSNGSVVIKLTTNEVVTEPFVDFLIEVSSPEGSLYREFTVLVDPPSSYEQPLAPATALPAITAKQYSVPLQTYDRASGERVAAETTWGGESVKVNRNNTLFGIAARVNTDANISTEQMAIALYEANPQAFYKNNINALSAGSTLKIPDKNTILRVSRKQAGAEFKRQNQAWQGRVAVSPEQRAPGDEEAKLTLAAPAEEDVGERAEVTEAEKEGVKTGGEAAVSVPDLTGQTQENRQLQERLRKLEQQMAEMQKIIALKDQQLAALQGGIPAPQPEAPQPEAVAPQPEAPAPQPEAVIPQPEAPTPQPEAVAPQPEAPVPQPEAVVPQPETPAPEAVTPQPEAPAPVAAKKPPTVKVPPKPPVEPEKPVLTYTILGLGGIGTLGLFAWLWLRKRRIEEEQGRESMFASSSQISLPSSDDELLVPNVIGNTPSYGASATGSSSFLDSFGSEFTVFDTDQNEVDPISEADVYLAYGRYQQAEELMRNAIAEQPGRDECKLKLLEIFYTNNNKQAFEDYARELEHAGKKADTAFWARVTEMGGELIPDSPLFADVKLPGSDFFERPARKEEAVSHDVEPVAETEKAGGKPADFSTPDEEEKKAAPFLIESEASEADTTFDFDLSSFEAAPDEEVAAGQAASEFLAPAAEVEPVALEERQDMATFDFNLDFDATVTELPASVELDRKDGSVEEFESFDFFSAPSESSAGAMDFQLEQESVAETGRSTMETPLDELSMEADTVLGKTYEESGLSADSGFVRLEDMDDEPTEEFQGLDFGEGFNLSDMDELETKIDLAKAYIDMGDTDAAREIAEDVLARGNAEQKREAQAIIDGL